MHIKLDYISELYLFILIHVPESNRTKRHINIFGSKTVRSRPRHYLNRKVRHLPSKLESELLFNNFLSKQDIDLVI